MSGDANRDGRSCFQPLQALREKKPVWFAVWSDYVHGRNEVYHFLAHAGLFFDAVLFLYIDGHLVVQTIVMCIFVLGEEVLKACDSI